MWPTIIVTLKLAVPATIINVGVSVPVAFALRRNSPYQKFVTTLLVIPVTLGTVLIADGMLTYFGPNGWFSQAVQGLHLYSDEVRLTHNYWGVLISLIVSGFPFAFLLTLSYVTGIDPTLARAAATLGASPWEQFLQIYLPLLMPGLTMAACLVVRAGVLGVSLGGAARRACRTDAGDLDSRGRSRIRKLRLFARLRHRDGDGLRAVAGGGRHAEHAPLLLHGPVTGGKG
jgi:ABC-type spermidine/putrescine transport system permease subunit I